MENNIAMNRSINKNQENNEPLSIEQLKYLKGMNACAGHYSKDNFNILNKCAKGKCKKCWDYAIKKAGE